MNKCAFCPTEAKKLSGEHIWDDWLNRELPTKRFSVRQKRSLTDPFREYDALILKEKLPVVCERCNNTWTSQLTSRMKVAFSAVIIDGSALSILPSGLSLLAAYTVMKAVVGDQQFRQEPFFPLAARERFRNSLAIPADVQIWIASFYGVHAYSGRFVSGILSANAPGPYYGVEFLTFTYVVGHLVLQLLAPRWKDVRNRGRLLPAIRPDAFWNPVTTRFWPNYATPVAWPPPKSIGDDVLKPFIDRFNVPINVRIG